MQKHHSFGQSFGDYGIVVAGRGFVHSGEITYAKLWSAQHLLRERFGMKLFPVGLEDRGAEHASDTIRTHAIYVGKDVCHHAVLTEFNLDSARSVLASIDWAGIAEHLPATWRPPLAQAADGVYCTPWSLSRQTAVHLVYGVRVNWVNTKWNEPIGGTRPATTSDKSEFFYGGEMFDLNDVSEEEWMEGDEVDGVWGESLAYCDNDMPAAVSVDIRPEAHQHRQSSIAADGKYYLLVAPGYFAR